MAKRNQLSRAIEAFSAAVTTYTGKRDEALTANDSKKAHNWTQRAARAEMFANMLSDEQNANAFARFDCNADAVLRLAIYAQDKVGQILRAVGREQPLREFTSNHSTREVLRALIAGEMRSKGLSAGLLGSYNANPNVSSTQTSSSVNALRMLGIIKTDGASRAHVIVEEFRDVAIALAA